MINPLKQAPLDKYFVSPVVAHIPQQKRKNPKISGIARFTKYLQVSEEEHGLFVTKAASSEDLREAFANYGEIREIKVFERYAFVLFENNVDIESLAEKDHSIGGRRIYVDKIKGKDPKFIPLRSKRKMNLWHNYIDKF